MRRSLASVLVVGAVVAGCRHRAAVMPTPAPGALAEESCWWTAWRSVLPLDTVGARFTTAYAGVGLDQVTAARVGDTVRVSAGPTTLDTRDGLAHSARMVAYQRGDTTFFRTYAAIGWPPTPAGATPDSAAATRRLLGLCGDVMRAAGTAATAPRGPDAEAALAVWTRRP